MIFRDVFRAVATRLVGPPDHPELMSGEELLYGSKHTGADAPSLFYGNTQTLARMARGDQNPRWSGDWR